MSTHTHAHTRTRTHTHTHTHTHIQSSLYRSELIVFPPLQFMHLTNYAINKHNEDFEAPTGGGIIEGKNSQKFALHNIYRVSRGLLRISFDISEILKSSRDTRCILCTVFGFRIMYLVCTHNMYRVARGLLRISEMSTNPAYCACTRAIPARYRVA